MNMRFFPDFLSPFYFILEFLLSGSSCLSIPVSSLSPNDLWAGPFKLLLHCGNPVRRGTWLDWLFLSYPESGD